MSRFQCKPPTNTILFFRLLLGSITRVPPPDQPHLASYFRYEDLCPKQIFIWHKPAQEVLRESPNLPAGVETQRPESAGHHGGVSGILCSAVNAFAYS